ncbi:hypothetical protein [Okeania sp. KiyG1]|uniref:hypothetical protein n=1 Tax=Okeania sp. KiyG1 TaxID=2720165 RepID=UPI001922647C|nr:hypothetical protein [Okeania sp. KiyG1]
MRESLTLIINAAVNILEVVQPKTKVETAKTKVAETSVQLSLFNEVAEGQRSIIFGRGDMVNHPLKRMFVSVSRQPALNLSSSDLSV